MSKTTVAHVENRQLRPIDQFRTSLELQSSELARMLPAHVSVEKFKRVVLTAVAMNPDLLKADRRSLFLACHKSAADGLMPDAREAVLVVYREQVQYQPMYQGLLKVVRNSGDLATISAHVARERDHFRYQLGDDPRIDHVPFLGGDAGKAVAVYAIAITKDGARYRDVMSRDDVEKVRKSSRAPNSPAWANWWDEMAKKTVLRRLSKILPKSTDREADDLERVIHSDDEASGFSDVPDTKPTREGFIEHADAAAARETAATQHGGDHVTDAGSADEAASPGASSADDPVSDDAAEREADKMQRAAASGDADDDGDDDMTVIVMKGANGKPDTAQWLKDVGDLLEQAADTEALVEIDAANSPVAKNLGATVERNYRMHVARARKRLEGGAA